MSTPSVCFFFFFNDTATTEIYTLSLHDALPISRRLLRRVEDRGAAPRHPGGDDADRKSTRLNSSHLVISYAVFCLKKKKIVSLVAVVAVSISDVLMMDAMWLASYTAKSRTRLSH